MTWLCYIIPTKSCDLDWLDVYPNKLYHKFTSLIFGIKVLASSLPGGSSQWHLQRKEKLLRWKTWMVNDLMPIHGQNFEISSDIYFWYRHMTQLLQCRRDPTWWRAIPCLLPMLQKKHSLPRQHVLGFAICGFVDRELWNETGLQGEGSCTPIYSQSCQQSNSIAGYVSIETLFKPSSMPNYANMMFQHCVLE